MTQPSTYYRRRLRVVLLVAVSVVGPAAVYAYLNAGATLRRDRRYPTVTSQTPDEGQQQQQQHQQQQWRRGLEVASMVTVRSAGNFTERVSAFNAALSSLRAEELKRRGTAAWRAPTTRPLEVVSGARDDYLQLLANFSRVTTVVLPWLAAAANDSSAVAVSAWSSLADTSNLPMQAYYEWTGDDTLCSWIETPGKLHARYDVMYNRSCSRDVGDTARPSSLRPLLLNGKPINPDRYWPNGGTAYPANFYTDTPPNVFYVHVHRDALVTALGDVITDGLKLVLPTCSYDVKSSLPSSDDLSRVPLYDELYVVTQYWGTSVFHRMVEILPRIALHVQFLNANPQIRVAAPEAGGRTAELLEIAGVDGRRLVAGSARARLVYQPRSTGCGFANVPESQTLSRLYRDHIERTFPARPRDRLILVRRSGLRRFSEQTAIEAATRRAAAAFDLTFALFADNPTPSLNDTMTMFHSAVLVVAPHGAALSNILFSRPGTYVIEGVCNRPHVNLCYQRLAHILGHHWHGVTSRGGCESVVDVAATDVELYVKQYLHLWTSNKRA